jgi:hypothetical protein
MAAAVSGVVLEHLPGGMFREIPVADIARNTRERIEPEQGLRPRIRPRQCAQPALHVLQQRAAFGDFACPQHHLGAQRIDIRQHCRPTDGDAADERRDLQHFAFRRRQRLASCILVA